MRITSNKQLLYERRCSTGLILEQQLTQTCSNSLSMQLLSVQSLLPFRGNNLTLEVVQGSILVTFQISQTLQSLQNKLESVWYIARPLLDKDRFRNEALFQPGSPLLGCNGPLVTDSSELVDSLAGTGHDFCWCYLTIQWSMTCI